MLPILFEVKWTLRHKEYNLKPRQIEKSISIDYKRNSFHRFMLSWCIKTRIRLLLEAIHHEEQNINKTEILDRKQLTHKVTIGLKVATGFIYQ